MRTIILFFLTESKLCTSLIRGYLPSLNFVKIIVYTYYRPIHVYLFCLNVYTQITILRNMSGTGFED